MRYAMMLMAVCAALGGAARETAIYQGKLTSALNANGMAVTNLPSPQASGDAVNKAYVDSIGGLTPQAVTNIVEGYGYTTTNAVEDIVGVATNGLATTNYLAVAVCDIVTNDVAASWATGRRTPDTYLPSCAITNTAVRWNSSAAHWEVYLEGINDGAAVDGWYTGYVYDLEAVDPFETINTDYNSLTVTVGKVDFSSDVGRCVYATRARATRNALGLAYERDIAPTITQTVTKAYVEGLGISGGGGGAPVDYATVSNHAMNAYQYGETRFTEDVTNIIRGVMTGSDWSVTTNGVAVTGTVPSAPFWEHYNESYQWVVDLDGAYMPTGITDPNAALIEFDYNDYHYKATRIAQAYFYLTSNDLAITASPFSNNVAAIASGISPTLPSGIVTTNDSGIIDAGELSVYNSIGGVFNVGKNAIYYSDCRSGTVNVGGVYGDAELNVGGTKLFGVHYITGAYDYYDGLVWQMYTNQTTRQEAALMNGQIDLISSHLNGEDARFVVTNYDSTTAIPQAYVQVKVSNDWVNVWHEVNRWNAWTGSNFVWNTWGGFNPWKESVDSDLAFKADKCWGIYDSETGGYSPDGFTQISSSNILIAANMAYQKTITSGGAAWVLQCNSGHAHIGGDTNGYFRVMDGDGSVQIEIIKGDKVELGADASGISVDIENGNVMTIPYSVVSDEHPTIYCCTNLINAVWYEQGASGCPASVTWSGASGAWTAVVTPNSASYPTFFVKATFLSGGETYIHNAIPTKLDSLMIGNTKYYLGTTNINGTTVLTLSTTRQ